MSGVLYNYSETPWTFPKPKDPSFIHCWQSGCEAASARFFLASTRAVALCAEHGDVTRNSFTWTLLSFYVKVDEMVEISKDEFLMHEVMGS